MKIAVFHELQEGGARRAVNEISKRLKKENIVDLYLVDEKNDISENKYFTNVNFFKFKFRKWSGNNPIARFYKDTVELLNIYRLHRIIAQKIDDKNYDFVFVHPSRYTQAPFLLRFLKTKKIYYCQEVLRMVYEPELNIKNINFFKKYYEIVNRRIRKVIDKKNIKSADLILTNSNFTKNNIFKAYVLNSEVAYLGVDINFFKPQNSYKNIDILFIGSKDEDGGYNLLAHSLEFINVKPKVEYLITGENWINESKLKNLYAKSKIVIALYRNEPFGLIPLEAMASGAAIIALNQGGYKETVVNGKTGFLISNDPKLIAQKIEYLLSNAKLIISMGKYSRKLMENKWSWDKRVKDMEFFFK